MQTIPFNEVKNNLIGQPGTDRRDAYEAKLAKETGPKIKGILFSTPMVAAINEDRKTMTRREMNQQPVIPIGIRWNGIVGNEWCYRIVDEATVHVLAKSKYEVGDILYVLEEHKVTRRLRYGGLFYDWLVEFKATRGALPALQASSQRAAHKHQR